MNDVGSIFEQTLSILDYARQFLMSEAIGEARVTQAQNRKRACCSQPESSTRTKKKAVCRKEESC